MHWLTLLLQLINLRKSFHQTNAAIETAKQVAEKGKRAFLFAMALAMSTLFFFSGLLVAVIELGLQLERKDVHFSGLMISSSVLVAIGLLILGIGAWLSRAAAKPAEPLPPPRSPGEDRIKELLEVFLVSFLSKIAAPGQRKDPPRSE